MTAVLERIATKVRASLEEVEATKRVEAKRQEEEHKTEVRRRMRGAYRPQISAEVWQALRMRMRLTRPKAKSTYAYEGWQGQVIFTLPDETGYQTEWAVNFDLCDRETGRISSVSVPEISSNAEDHRMWLPRRIRRDRNSQINSPFPGCTWGETIAALAYQFQQDIAKNKEVIAREDEEQRQEQQRQRAENERQRQLRQAKEAVEEAALAERLALVNKVDVSVREQIGNAVSNLQFWPAGPVTLYRWSYCVGGFFDEGEWTANFEEGFALTDQLDENGYVTFIDNRPGQNAVKLDTQVHKPVVTRITLNTLDDAISYSKGQYGSCCLVEELTIRVNGAMMIDQYEYVHGRHPYCYGETLMKWEFCEGGSDEYTSEQRMLKPWLRRALGLPEGYVIEVRELLA